MDSTARLDIVIVLLLTSLSLSSSSPFLPVAGDGEGNSGTSSGLTGLWHVFRQAGHGITRILEQQPLREKEKSASPGTSFTIISRMRPQGQSIEPYGDEAVKKPPRPAWPGIAGRKDDSAEQQDEALRLNKKADDGQGFFIIKNGLLQFREGIPVPESEPVGSNGKRTITHFVTKPSDKQRRPQKWTSTTTIPPPPPPPPLPNQSSEDRQTLESLTNSPSPAIQVRPVAASSRKPIDLSAAENRIDGSAVYDRATTLPPTPAAVMAVKVNDTMRYAATHSFSNGTVVFERSLGSLGRDSTNPSASASIPWRDLAEVESFYPGFARAAGNHPVRVIVHNQILTSNDEEDATERPVEKRPDAANSGIITSRPRTGIQQQKEKFGASVTVELAKPLVVTDVPSSPTEEQMSPPMPMMQSNNNKNATQTLTPSSSTWLVQLNDNATESSSEPISDWQAASNLMQPPKLSSQAELNSLVKISTTQTPTTTATTTTRKPSTQAPQSRVTPDNPFSSIFKKWASNLSSSSSTTTSTEQSTSSRTLDTVDDASVTTLPSVTIGKWTVVTNVRNTTQSPVVPDSLAAVFKKWTSTASSSTTSSPPQSNRWGVSKTTPKSRIQETTEASTTTTTAVIPQSSLSPITTSTTTPAETTTASATFIPFHSVSVLLTAKPDASSKANFRRRPVPASSNKMASLILAHTSALMSGKRPQPVSIASSDLEASPRSRQEENYVVGGHKDSPAVHVIVATAIPSDDLRYRSLNGGGDASRNSAAASNVSTLWNWPFASSFLEHHPAEGTLEESFDPVDANATPISSLTLQRRVNQSNSDDDGDAAAGNLPLFPRFTCDREVDEMESVFTNPSYPAADVTAGRCSFRLKVTSPTVCQVRIEFRDSRMLQPRSGSCTDQYLIASGAVLPHPSASIRDRFCGWNTDQHFYMELSAPNGTQRRNVNLHVDTLQAGHAYRYAMIVQQIDCSPVRPNPLKAPSGCFQYWNSGRTGVVKSFNYDGGRYWSNQSYRICIRSSGGACTLALSSVDASDFNLHRVGTRTLSGVGHSSCTRDYIWIPGTIETLASKKSDELDDRYCGAKLSDLDGEPVPGVVIAQMHSDLHVMEFRTGQIDPLDSDDQDDNNNTNGFRISFTQMTECPTTPVVVSEGEYPI